MKRTLSCLLLLVSVLIVCACQSVSKIQGTLSELKNRIAGEESVAYHNVAPDTLPEVGKTAIAAIERGKRGMLEASPYITVNPQGKKFENTTDYQQFFRRNTIIMDFAILPDGAYVQDMLTESVDRFGRIDVSHERIVYSLREPTKSEAAAIAESMIRTSRSVSYMDSASRMRFKKSVVDFQRSHGLSADGVMGMHTAKTMAREESVLDVQEMTNRIVLPETPRTLLYAVPYEIVSRNPAKFNKGFESLEAVKAHALTPDTFRKIDRTGQQFTIFLYFLDRIDPERDIRIALASSEYRWSEIVTPSAYPPGEWPVLIESFLIEETMGASPLYVNIFQKAKFAYTCIGSHRVK